MSLLSIQVLTTRYDDSCKRFEAASIGTRISCRLIRYAAIDYLAFGLNWLADKLSWADCFWQIKRCRLLERVSMASFDCSNGTSIDLVEKERKSETLLLSFRGHHFFNVSLCLYPISASLTNKRFQLVDRRLVLVHDYEREEEEEGRR